MQALRFYFRRHQMLATILVCAALCMKAVVPAGFMLQADSRALTMSLCQDAPGAAVLKIALPASDQVPDTTGKHLGHEGVCPFSALTLVSLTGADAAMLAALLAFVLALGTPTVRRPALPPAPYLRPPMRAPPRPC